jgi:murein DD-endopeptidase MepM/ murein hydrolase activator NlpD
MLTAPATAISRSLAPSPAPAPPRGSWLPPVGGLPVTVVHPFAAPPGPYAAGHRGVDLAADAGSVVHAPTAGRVVVAGQVAGRPLVVLLHDGGVRTTYEPVAPSVSVGDEVGAGQPIGSLVTAASHCLPSPCLHWGARTGAGDAERYLDPLALLAGHGPPRLLPLDGHRS